MPTGDLIANRGRFHHTVQIVCYFGIKLTLYALFWTYAIPAIHDHRMEAKGLVLGTWDQCSQRDGPSALKADCGRYGICSNDLQSLTAPCSHLQSLVLKVTRDYPLFSYRFCVLFIYSGVPSFVFVVLPCRPLLFPLS